MKATRDAFGDVLPLLFAEHPELIAIDGDLGKATKISSIKKDYPNRFIQGGISEANMIGVAAGLSQYNYLPVVASFASFLTGRYDIIRCSLAYPNCNTILVGTHGGLAIGKDGVTQMGLEDIALMRALPNMKVYNPSDYDNTVNLMKELVKGYKNKTIAGPSYVRLGRQPVSLSKIPILYHSNTRNKLFIHIYYTGCVKDLVKEVATELSEYNIFIQVIYIEQLKPLKHNCEGKADYIVTIEDHSIIGGLGSAILESENNTPVIRIGLNDEFPESGPPDQLYKKYGLNKDLIVKKILSRILAK